MNAACCVVGILQVSGTVTRTTDVRPELLAGSFKCRKCMSRVPLVEQQYGYTEPMRCLNPQCKSKGVREGDTMLSEDDASVLACVWMLTGGGRGSVWRQSWSLDMQESRFVDWQRVRVQVRAETHHASFPERRAILPLPWNTQIIH